MPPVNQPRQARSQRTMNRILDAAELLLEDKPFNELSVQEIVRAAGSSVGSFYGRFQDKDGLLQALDERYFDTIIQLIETADAELPWDQLSLAETVQALAELIVTLHSQKQGVQRTLIMAARQNPDQGVRAREDRLWAAVPTLVERLAAYEAEIRPRPAGPAIQFALFQMYYSAREMMLWPHLARNMPFQGEALASALSASCLAYLRHADPPE